MKLSFQPRSSAAFRMAFNYSVLLVLSLLILFTIFYMQTVNVLQNRIDRQIISSTNRLLEEYAQDGQPALVKQIRNHFRDDIYSDTEIYLLVNAEGEKIIGNIPAIPPLLQTRKGLAEARVIRNGREARGRMAVETLSDGSRLLVGSDINHQLEIEALFNRAGLIAGLLGLIMSIGGAFLFHRELKLRIAGIQKLVTHVRQGDLSQRLPVAEENDEFSRMNMDINDMLDQQQRLMDGVRHVSNTIAHNLRTPLTRILLRLRKSGQEDPQAREETLRFATREIEELGIMFDKMLNIAEVESGTRRQAFAPIALNDVVADVMELYEPVAEEKGISLHVHFSDTPMILGDRDLLASAVANLIDNAIKYAGQNATVEVSTMSDLHESIISVHDNGPGIPDDDLPHIGRHFYRVDRTRPGYGLGVASIMAIVQLHSGRIVYQNTSPGLMVQMYFKSHTS
ncbi:HAMP domain-containing sensor histidine kinase [Oxalicibacterium faecigallinarum]|uniref:histidine kinase n=1 Tax=Oxalicibacterium faecigallinarum TaxID=573741 RepID=A0A8J3B0D4_9BURK|nr:HAMP domain-containing sensor histidine kinase [Oxalicibacterium faecigallinarum]GGI21121.1 two-component sensor histidine kinase [Oxalicibacterium faecigallinarum]